MDDCHHSDDALQTLLAELGDPAVLAALATLAQFDLPTPISTVVDRIVDHQRPSALAALARLAALGLADQGRFDQHGAGKASGRPCDRPDQGGLIALTVGGRELLDLLNALDTLAQRVWPPEGRPSAHSADRSS